VFLHVTLTNGRFSFERQKQRSIGCGLNGESLANQNHLLRGYWMDLVEHT